MNEKVSELSEAWRDYFEWKKHVREQRRKKQDPDIFSTFENAKVGARALLTDFSSEPNDSVITIFETPKDNFKIDAISNHDEFELHRDEYAPEDVVAIVFFRDDEPFVKEMKSNPIQ